MVVTISPPTAALLKEQVGHLRQQTDNLADTLLLSALQTVGEDYAETCQAIAEGLADVEAGRVTSFEDVRAHWEKQQVGRRQKTQAAA